MTWINVFRRDWNIASSVPLQILQGTIHNRCWVWKGTEGDFHKKPMKVDFVSVKCVKNGYHGGPKIGKISQCCIWMVPKKRKSISQCLDGAKCSQNSMSKHSKNTIGWNHFWKAILIFILWVFMSRLDICMFHIQYAFISWKLFDMGYPLQNEFEFIVVQTQSIEKMFGYIM